MRECKSQDAVELEAVSLLSYWISPATGYVFNKSKQYNLLMNYEWLSYPIPLNGHFHFRLQISLCCPAKLSDCVYESNAERFDASSEETLDKK